MQAGCVLRHPQLWETALEIVALIVLGIGLFPAAQAAWAQYLVIRHWRNSRQGDPARIARYREQDAANKKWRLAGYFVIPALLVLFAKLCNGGY